MMKRNLVLGALLLLAVSAFAQKFEKLAQTPPMGWNSWNTFGTRISEELVKKTADQMVASGMRDAGYVYLVLDDGWMMRKRDSITGDLVADPVKFPSGMKAVADYVHSKGLKFGLYNCGGTMTCAKYPGSHGYEAQDARLYASWGIDYLKYDWCYSEGFDAKESYTKMSQALKDAGHPIIFSLCEWGTTKPWTWAKDVGHLWRTTGDIGNVFDGIKQYDTWHSLGVMRIVDLHADLYPYAGPGFWNDPDMMEVGNGQTETEDRTHFSVWCMMASPLIAGNDLTKMSDTTIRILTNKDAIAINQDKLGRQGFRYSNKDSLQAWFKPLADGDWAVCFVNRSNRSQTVRFDWKKEKVIYSVNQQALNAGKQAYKLFDVWEKKARGTTAQPFIHKLAPHESVMMRMRK